MFHVQGNYIRKEITSHLQTIASHFHIVIIYTHTHTYRRNMYPHTHKHRCKIHAHTHTAPHSASICRPGRRSAPAAGRTVLIPRLFPLTTTIRLSSGVFNLFTPPRKLRLDALLPTAAISMQMQERRRATMASAVPCTPSSRTRGSAPLCSFTAFYCIVVL